MLSFARLTLKNICLTCITENFEMFSRWYKESYELQKNFEFLQRCYSQEIVYKLKEKQKFSREYMPFLLNRHLKTIDLHWFHDCNLHALEKRLLEIGDTVEKLVLRSDHQEEFISRIVTHLPNVKSLSLVYTCASDNTLNFIGKYCPKLEELNLSWCPITDKGLENLCYPFGNGQKSSCRLQLLKVLRTFVTDFGVKYILDEMESLKELPYENLRNLFRDIYQTNNGNKTYNLNTINEIKPISDPCQVLAYSVLCPEIRTLLIGITSAKVLNACSGFCNLEHVKLINLYCRYQKVSIDKFLESRGQNLRHLQLGSFSISTSTLIQCCPNLEELSFYKMAFKHTDQEESNSFRFLKSFTLVSFDFSNDENAAKSIVTVLSLSPNLSNLVLNYCRGCGNSDMTQEILKLPALKFVDFSNSDVDISFVETLIFTQTNIESIKIWDCQAISSTERTLLKRKLQLFE